ncbi:hypothetical protein KC887_09610, partial [Candidatus Kaiserbacteria bacterium]|nr:hypothetical protein [Candidatus Kaiserbacteria bacterium]
DDEYGNAERNTTEKRVFAVGRDRVKSWGGGGVTEVLTPTDPVSESRAMTIGPRLDFSTDKAWLGQLYHPAEGWDYMFGEWAFSYAEVTMLLASTYLVKVSGSANVAMPLVSLSDDGPSSGSITTDKTLPVAEIGLQAAGVASTTIPYSWGTSGNYGTYRVIYPWSGVIERPLEGKTVASYSRTQYSGSSSSVEYQAGIRLDFDGSSTKIWDSRNDNTYVKAQTVPIADHDIYGLSNSNGADMTTVDDALYWGQHITSPHTPTGLDVGPIPATRGISTKTIQYDMVINGAAVTGRLYEEQSGSFSVSCPTGSLAEIVFSRNKSSGSAPVITKKTGYYDSYLATPSGWVGSYGGLGIYSGPITFTAYVSPATDICWIKEYYKTGGFGADNQELVAVDEINAKYSGMQSTFASMTMFSSETVARDNILTPYYVASINPSVTLDNSAMSWSSKDFILYDETNGVYISVESSFVGVDTAATLTVSLKVQTRHHTTTQTLGEYNYTYSQLVQEREIGTTGKYAMPSPQIRAIFAPLYQEQGSFKGAHYVTEEEENNGATPAHLFNF